MKNIHLHNISSDSRRIVLGNSMSVWSCMSFIVGFIVGFIGGFIGGFVLFISQT